MTGHCILLYTFYMRKRRNFSLLLNEEKIHIYKKQMATNLSVQTYVVAIHSLHEGDSEGGA